MQYEPRTIAYLCELRHPPLQPDAAPIQKIHNEMFQSGAPTYTSFQVTEQGAVLSRPIAEPGAASSVTFLADRILFQEELSGLTVDDFVQRVVNVAGRLGAQRGIQLFIAQIVTIRSLVNPRTFRDSRSFMQEGVFGFDAALEGFDREPNLFGLRLVFPPSQESPNAFNLRVESFAGDPRSLFLENQGSFGPTVAAQGLAPLEQNIRATYEFVVEQALRFLGPFDARQEA